MEHLSRLETAVSAAIGRVSVDKFNGVLELRVKAVDFIKSKNTEALNRVIQKIEQFK